MDAILKPLGELIIKSLPTLFILIVLHFFLKKVFFEPLGAILQRRYEATEGAQKAAQLSLDRAAQKAAAYESALQAARLELYREHEEHRMRWAAERETALQEIRDQAHIMVDAAKDQIARENAAARDQLVPESEKIAERLAERILFGSAA